MLSGPTMATGPDDVVHLAYTAGDGTARYRWSEAVRVAPQVAVQNAVDSDQVGADAIVDGDTLHVVFSEAATGRLMHVAGRDGAWPAPQPVVT